MNIEEVITQFEIDHKGKYSKEDHEKIVSAMKSLGLNDFLIKYRNDVKTADGSFYSIFFHDEEDLIHVHPTMIVARCEFEGFQPGIRSKYPVYPYMVVLSNWSSKSEDRRPICPNCFVEIPLVGQCGMCGFDLDEIDND